ncbi:hypothetical protein [Pelagibius sp. 7325]|uniref:hypothetical protein n=1 Tax=Pelagibius sp. 7325 TaxID=3131994 RepID=UPI0030EF1991
MADKDRSEIEQDKIEAAPGVKAETAEEESPEQRARREARRRVLTGGLASAPLILTLASRPALATWGSGGGTDQWGKCGYSGMLSGNLSQVNTTTTWCKGKTPKYWKTKEDDCKRHFLTGPCNPIYMDYTDCNDYSVPSKYALNNYRKVLQRNYWANRAKIQKVDEYLYWLDRYPGLDSPPFGTRFSEVFGGNIAQDSRLTLMQALWLDEESPYPPSGNAGPTPLLAHSAAAYCNACEYGEESFGLSPRGVVDLVKDHIYSDPFGLEEMLRMMNDQG